MIDPNTHKFTFQMTLNQINVILSHLNNGVHKEVRPTIDFIQGTFNAEVSKIEAEEREAEAKKAEEIKECEIKEETELKIEGD